MNNKNEFINLKRYLDVLVEEYHTPGVDCIVYKDHKILFRYYTGMSDLEKQKKMQGDELYFIFSMTKMLTCVSAMQLYEKGVYRLNDAVSMYLPEFTKMRISETDFAKNPITIKDIFTMGAGLDYDLNSKAIIEAKKQGKRTTREIVAAMANTSLGFEPGSRFRYSLCHDVLGALIEVWSGQKLGKYMKEHIFEPIGMKNTFFKVPKEEYILSKMAARYSFLNGYPKRLPLECVYNLTDEYESGGAGLISCTEDYALFLDALACGGIAKNGIRILSESTVELMKTNHLSGRQLDDFYKLKAGYGYGLGVRTHIEPNISGSISPIGEFGWDGAAGAFSMVDMNNKISLTYFQHIGNWDSNIHKEIRNKLYEDLF